MKVIEVFADVACPFTHVGLLKFRAYRRERGRNEPLLRLRAWPLELVNDSPLDGLALTPKIEALRRDVAASLFAGFDEHRFPASTLPALAGEAAAYRRGVEVGEQFSLAVRHALFEDGLDVSDPVVVRTLCEAHGVPSPTDDDERAVRDDFAEGQRRQVVGSPYFITADGEFFCPSLAIQHDAEGFQVHFDPAGFERFAAAAIG
jgi:predicted DsbA family dithiol-disulfide isomerase